MQCTRDQLKAFFETGDRPTQAQFANLIDSFYNILQDSGLSVDVVNIVVTGNSGAPYYAAIRFDGGGLVSVVGSGNTQSINLYSGSKYVSNYYNASDNVYYMQIVGDNTTTIKIRNFDGSKVWAMNPDGSMTIDKLIVSKQTARLVAALTATATLTTANEEVLVNCTSGAKVITLPVAAGNKFTIMKTDATANNLTVIGASGTINGAANKIWNVQYKAYTFVCDGTNYFITAQS